MPDITFVTPTLWALFILATFVGLGRCLLGINRENPNWGIDACVGIGIFLAATGIAVALGVATQIYFTTFGILGVIIFCIQFTKKKRQKRNWIADLTAIPAIFVAVTAFLASIWNLSLNANINYNDDVIAYMTLAQKMLQTGELFEPFSLRRAGTFGGFISIQAFVLSYSQLSNLAIPEWGMSRIILLGLALGATRKLRISNPILGGILCLIPVLAVFPRGNFNVQAFGIAVSLGGLLLLCQSLAPSEKKPRWKQFVAIGLCLAAAATMRPTFPIALGCVILLLGLTQKEYKNTLITLGTALLTIIPWMISLYVSNQTISLPPFSGNTNPEMMKMTASGGVLQSLYRTIVILAQPHIFLPMATALILGWNSKTRIYFWAGCILTIFITAYMNSESESWQIIYYAGPIAFMALFASILHRAQYAPPTYQEKDYIALALTSVMAATLSLKPQIGFSKSEIPDPLKDRLWTQIPAGEGEILTKHMFKKHVCFEAEHAWVFDIIQNSIPEGSKVFAIITMAPFLDYRKNQIYNADNIGAASPSPGLPIGKSPEALKTYLRSLGIQYILADDFNRTDIYGNMYSRNEWEAKDLPNIPAHWGKIWYPTYIWAFDAIDELAKTNPTQQIGPIRVIDITKP